MSTVVALVDRRNRLHIFLSSEQILKNPATNRGNAQLHSVANEKGLLKISSSVIGSRESPTDFVQGNGESITKGESQRAVALISLR